MVLDPHVLTLGFARRATAYKRSDLLVSNVERLRHIAATAGPLQIIYGGKAHPDDYQGKETIQRIIRVRERLGPDITLVYLSNYDLELARHMVAGGGCLAEHAAAAPGSLRHQRHEGRAQWRAQPQRARWLVD